MLGMPMASHWLPLNYNHSDFAYGSTVCMPYVHGLCLLLWFNCKTHFYSWRAYVIYTVKGLSTLEFISPLLSASVTFLLVTGDCLELTIHWAFESKPLKKYLCINDSVGTFKITPKFTWKHAVCLTANSQGDMSVRYPQQKHWQTLYSPNECRCHTSISCSLVTCPGSSGNRTPPEARRRQGI